MACVKRREFMPTWQWRVVARSKTQRAAVLFADAMARNKALAYGRLYADPDRTDLEPLGLELAQARLQFANEALWYMQEQLNASRPALHLGFTADPLKSGQSGCGCGA